MVEAIKSTLLIYRKKNWKNLFHDWNLEQVKFYQQTVKSTGYSQTGPPPKKEDFMSEVIYEMPEK
jgi:hypothetical protein